MEIYAQLVQEIRDILENDPQLAPVPDHHELMICYLEFLKEEIEKIDRQ